VSQIPLTHQERIEALRAFGYSEREATFLCLAALHGGYFLRRQYCQFLGKETSGSAAALIERAVAKEHVKVSTYANSTHVYHLCTRPFYAALGQVDNRNRRDRQPTTIKNKLMGLDFVLAHPENQYLATEQEKVDYFSGSLKIAPAALPAKLYPSAKTDAVTSRYFVDKYPIFITATTTDLPSPKVSFCFVDEGLMTVSRFETYLDQYGELFRILRGFHVVYIATRPLLFQAAERTFQHLFGNQTNPADGQSKDSRVTRMLEYFEARHLYESKQFTSFDRAKLIRFRDQRQEFLGPETEALFERWRAGSDRTLREIPIENSGQRATGGTFSTCHLEHNYDFFGTLTTF